MSIAFYTLGCKLNQAETDQLKEKAIKKGFKVAFTENQRFQGAERPDVTVVNACSVTGKAEKETRQIIHRIKRTWPRTYLIVTGCLAPQILLNKNIKEEVDEWVDNESKPNIINKLPKPGLAMVWKSDSYNFHKDFQQILFRTRALIKIQSGCQHFCSYCIVPYLRKNIFNRSPRSIIREIKEKERIGFKEVVLVGTNIGKYNYRLQVTGYKLRKYNLVDLLKEILARTNIPRIRLSSLWPTDMTGELLELIRTDYRICSHIHLSIQSGSDKILKKMNRPYTREELKEIITNLSRISGLNITADIIVGFPAESEKDFHQTYDLIKSFPFLKLHVFRFSPRSETRAAKMTAHVPESVKKERAYLMEALGKKLSQEVRKKYSGRVLSVLFESKRGGYWSGFSPNYLRVYTKSREYLANQIVKVKLIGLYEEGLRG